MKMQYNRFFVGWDFGSGCIFLAFGLWWYGISLICLGFLQAYLEHVKDEKAKNK